LYLVEHIRRYRIQQTGRDKERYKIAEEVPVLKRWIEKIK
jgi:hypothetical protein